MKQESCCRSSEGRRQRLNLSICMKNELHGSQRRQGLTEAVKLEDAVCKGPKDRPGKIELVFLTACISHEGWIELRLLCKAQIELLLWGWSFEKRGMTGGPQLDTARGGKASIKLVGLRPI